MYKVKNLFMLCLILLTMAVGVASADLVGHWKLDEGSGTTALDSSGNGNDGTFMGDPLWSDPGILFDGVDDWIDLGNPEVVPAGLSPRSVCAWVMAQSLATGWTSAVGFGTPSTGQAFGFAKYGAQLSGFGVSSDLLVDNFFEIGVWHHLCLTYDGATAVLYSDGEELVSGARTWNLVQSAARIGRQINSYPDFWNGGVADVRLYDHVLSLGEIADVMLGDNPGVCSGPIPRNEITDVPRDGVTLEWTAGEYAASHDVYFGMSFEDVNAATKNSPEFKRNQAEAAYALDRLEFKQTYYWRIDEVNDTEPNSPWQGDVWSFEVEPEGIMVDQLTATASSQNSATEGPNNTINGVGLNPDGSHSQDKTTMWLSAKSDPSPWIRYDLSEPQRLSEMLVWNHNTQSEEDLGFGIMEARILVSRDGIDFTDLGIVTLAQSAETAVDLQGLFARSVKIAVVSNYDGSKSGLSEVRLYAIPSGARELSPADGATNVDTATAILTWRAGREADAHNVYLGTDEQAVIDGTAPMVTVPAASTTSDLELGRTYYWRVDEVNSVEDPAVWVGLVQSFTTADSILVDDMESYKNQAGLYIFEAWVDGYQINDNGSLVGVGADFEAEKAVVHGGSQSLPMTYGDQGIADSWATLAIETPKDWNKHGIKSLSLYFHGNTTNTAGQLYVKVNNTKFEYKGVATDIQTNAWFPFTVNLAGVTTVNSLTIGVAGGAGMLIVDDIRLYPQVSELVTPVAPGTAELMASYAFEGNYQDGSGNGRHGTAVGAAVITSDAQRGSVLSLDGVDSCVDLGPSGDPNQGFNPAGSFTVAAWVNITAYTSNWGHAILSNRGESNVGWKLRRHSSTSNLTFTVRGTAGADDPRGTVDMGAMMGSWIQVTAVFDAEAGSRSVYVNGLLDTSIVDGGACTASTHNVFIGAGASATNVPEGFFNGMIDDVKIYNRALSQAETLGLAGRTYPIYKSF